MSTHRTALTFKLGPKPARQSGLIPGLVLLHGRGADEDDLLGLVPYIDPRFQIISVRAPFSYPYGGYTWYDLESLGTPHEGRFAQSYDLLVQFVTERPNDDQVDPHQIYLVGFSMGAVMSFAVSLSHPQQIAGVVAHSGYVPENSRLKFRWDDAKTTKFFIAHGTADPVIPIELGRRAHSLLVSKGLTVEHHEYSFGHQISEQSLADLTTWLKRCLDDRS